MMDTLTGCATDRGPFALTNCDIGFHNILLNENLSIIGMIDCNTVKTAPIHVVAQIPGLSDMMIAKPGLATMKPMAKRVFAEGTIIYDKCVDMIANAEVS